MAEKRRGSPLDILLLCGRSEVNETLSYQVTWPQAFEDHPDFRCTPLNLLDFGITARLKRFFHPSESRFDAVVILHSVYSNSPLLKGRLFDRIASWDVPKAVFLGNEYKLMPEKMAFCEELDVDVLVSQSHNPEIHDLYEQRLDCDAIFLPNAGLMPDLFEHGPPLEDRPIDVGFRAHETPLYLGHQDKEEIARFFQRAGPNLGLDTDISLSPEDRFALSGWADFLRRCKAVLGTEAGSDYFELTDQTRKAVNSYVESHPDAGLPDVRSEFFDDYRDRIDGRMIASRHIEAAGTKTLQILFEGEYGGYLKPDEHYIPLKKDFSNVDQVVEKFRDPEYCRRITDNAYELVQRELTYDRLLDEFHGALATQV